LQQRVRLDPVMDVGLLDESRGGRVEMIRADTMPVAQGWEYMTEHGFAQEAVELVSHLREKLASPSIESGQYDLVIDPSNLWLVIHESIGHATELDRALGYEANYAGTTFVTPDRLGELRYGSPAMHVTGDRTVPNGLATIAFDDEGVAAQEWDIIADGVLVGYQTDRQVAGRIGLDRSNGCAFADRWNKFPLERMPNVSLQPDPHRDTPIADLSGTTFTSPASASTGSAMGRSRARCAMSATSHARRTSGVRWKRSAASQPGGCRPPSPAARASRTRRLRCPTDARRACSGRSTS
jgi:TldD protein